MAASRLLRPLLLLLLALGLLLGGLAVLLHALLAVANFLNR